MREPKPLMMSVAAVLVALLCWLVVQAQPETGASPSNPEPLLTGLAARVTHGWIDDRMPLAVLEARNGRLYVTCGTVSLLGKRLLARHGIESRVVVTLTRRAFNGIDDGHTMLEVREHGRWVLYDLDNNRKAVDRYGRGVSLAQQLRPGRRWKVIAHDRKLDVRGVSPKIARYVAGLRLPEWYDRVLGVPLYESHGGYVYFSDHERVARYARERGQPFIWGGA